jgi:hypothetical protein
MAENGNTSPGGENNGEEGGKKRFSLKHLVPALRAKLHGVFSRKKDAPADKAPKDKVPDDKANAGFRAAARKILNDHPELKRKTLIVNAVTHKWTGTLAAKIKGGLSRKFRKNLRQAEKPGAGPQIVRGKRVNAVVATPGADGNFDLHREAGQLLVPRGLAVDKYFAALFGFSPAVEQATGDAYGVIRHLQEYGMKSEGLSALSILRARAFLQTGDQENLTSFVVDKVLADRNFENVKPKDVVTKIQEYVEKYAPPPEAARKLAADFAPVKGKLQPPTEDSLKTLAEITLNPKADAATFYLGQRALQDFFRDGQGVDMTTEYWTQAKATIAARLPAISFENMFPKPAAEPPKRKLGKA